MSALLAMLRGQVSDVTSVNALINIQFEIAYSTTVVEFNTTMALVVLMERCNFVSAGIETETTGHSLYRKLI